MELRATKKKLVEQTEIENSNSALFAVKDRTIEESSATIESLKVEISDRQQQIKVYLYI